MTPDLPAREGFILSEDIIWEDAGQGVRRQVLGYDGHLMMVRVEFDKGSIGYVHRHAHRQVTYITEGTFEVQVGKEKRVLRRGDCFFITPDIDHGVVALERSTLVDVFTPVREDFIPVSPG
jgi:quercetin dioxygenase-like cupin family protein